MLSDVKDRLLRRVAKDIAPNSFVNLGIGYPLEVVNYLPSDFPVTLHSENGMSGVGPVLPYEDADRNLIDAGGLYVSAIPGSAFFDSAVSFALVRSGRLDLTLLGALEVSEKGDLANWTIPGKFCPGAGGAVELAQKAKRVHVIMTHTDKTGASKIKSNCALPLTAPNCVDRIYTDMAVIDVTDEGLVLREIRTGVSLDEVIAATAAPLKFDQENLGAF